MNAPNRITLARVICIPLFLLFFSYPFEWGNMDMFGHILPIHEFIGAVLFAVLSLTDWVDGYVARKYQLITNFGKFLDPLADKLLMTAGYIVLVDMGLVPAWMVVIILSREFAVTGLRLLLAGTGEVMAAAYIGKIKTTFQILSVLLFLLGFTGLFTQIILWVALVVTIYSGIDYFIKGKEAFKDIK